MNSNTDDITTKIINKALDIGFSACGITHTHPLDSETEHLLDWLRRGYNGTMKYMENNIDKRLNPNGLVADACSAIVVLLNYNPPRSIAEDKPQVSKYAYGVDYHFVVRSMLKRLLLDIQHDITPCNGVFFVDSAPILEKALAVRAGLGWIGKNSLLINSTYGSMTFIGTLFVDIPLRYNTHTEPNRCGSCTRCIDVCPTKALVAPQILDAKRCISYLNKTHKGSIDPSLKTLIGNRVWGCDICIDACPYNKNTPHHNIAELTAKDELFTIDLNSISRRRLRRLIMRKPPDNQLGTGS